MTSDTSLNQLWESVPLRKDNFEPLELSGLPKSARLYLEHSITAGNPLSNAVRLNMHGEIKLKRWLPFKAEQVIIWKQGFIWKATVRMFGIPIRGFDRLTNGEGEMRWKLLGILPIMSISGSDITRSAAGRVNAESIWLPSTLCSDDVSWEISNSSHIRANFTAYTETANLELEVGENGQLKSLKLPRWGNPEGDKFRYVDFGAIIEEENTYDGYTIPTQLRVGWHFGTSRFESEGEFFRVTIDEAKYR